MSAVKKVVDLLWYSPNYKNKRLANQLAAEFSELEEENKMRNAQFQRVP